mgnify:CR=1 FL=1
MVRFRPTIRVVLRLYRERTMGLQRTNEEVRSNELKQVIQSRSNKLNVITISVGLVYIVSRQTGSFYSQ